MIVLLLAFTPRLGRPTKRKKSWGRNGVLRINSTEVPIAAHDRRRHAQHRHPLTVSWAVRAMPLSHVAQARRGGAIHRTPRAISVNRLVNLSVDRFGWLDQSDACAAAAAMASATCFGLDNCGTWLVGRLTIWAEIFCAIAFCSAGWIM
jgi:hypothetical protein